MDQFNRRHFLAGLCAAPLTGVALGEVVAQPRKYKMLLNSGYSGAQAWFFLAEDNGHLRKEGIELEFTTGLGAYTAAPRMVTDRFDIGYGDINSLIEIVAKNPKAELDDAPIAVYVMFNAPPSTIVVAADGPVKTPKDLEGRKIAGHATDVALNTSPAFAKKAKLDASKVTIIPTPAGMREMVEEMLAGKTDAVFGYVTTITAAAMTANIEMGRLRFIKFNDYVPDLYGSALMVTRKLAREDPKLVSGVVRAFNRGLHDALKDYDAAIEAIARRDPKIRKDVERGRLIGTLNGEMSHWEGRRLGIGDVDDARLQRAIALIAETNKLPRVPAAREVFTRDFLPPEAERVKALAR